MKRATAFATAILLSAGVAEAMDKMEKVDIARDGIDVQTVTVSASGQGYNRIDTKHYTFHVRGWAEARKGFRIVSAWFYSGPTHKASHEFSLLPRNYGSGEKRTLKYPIAYKVPMAKISWSGPGPLDACKANFAKLRKAGFDTAAILSKSYDLEVEAIVGFGAAADRKGREASSIGLGGGSTYKHKTLSYPVDVECRGLPKRAP